MHTRVRTSTDRSRVFIRRPSGSYPYKWLASSRHRDGGICLILDRTSPQTSLFCSLLCRLGARMCLRARRYLRGVCVLYNAEGGVRMCILVSSALSTYLYLTRIFSVLSSQEKAEDLHLSPAICLSRRRKTQRYVPKAWATGRFLSFFRSCRSILCGEPPCSSTCRLASDQRRPGDVVREKKNPT